MVRRKKAKLAKGKHIIPHTTYEGWKIYYESPRLKAWIERLSECLLHIVEFQKMKNGEWLLVHAHWSQTTDPRYWIPHAEKFKEKNSERRKRWGRSVWSRIS
jgi:hypothetical protein